MVRSTGIENFYLNKVLNIRQEDLFKIIEEKEKFFRSYSDSPGEWVSKIPEISKSWFRSRSLGAPVLLHEEEFSQYVDNPYLKYVDNPDIIKEKYKFVIDCAKPVFERFRRKKPFDSEAYVLQIFDKNGVLIFNEGCMPKAYPCPKSGDAGIPYTEEILGTNAVALSIQTDYMVFLPDFLHCLPLDKLIALTIPVFNQSNKTFYYLGLALPVEKRPWEDGYKNASLETVNKALLLALALRVNLTMSYIYSDNAKNLYDSNNINNKSLKQALNDLEAITNLIGEGIFSIDDYGRITGTNEEVLYLLDYSSKSIVGKDISALLNKASSIVNIFQSRKNETKEIFTLNNKNNRSFHNLNNHSKGKKDYLKIYDTGLSAEFFFEDLIGKSTQLHQAIKLGKRFANSPENLLLTGESGTGKELFAQSIHNFSNPSGPFVAVNCAAIPGNLLESELFGYEKGSFTGADSGGKPGKFELAHGGTLFLDEIGDLPYEFQAVLLRVLQNKQIMRIGGRSYKKIDFRLITATNKNLEKMVKEGKFREDLYYRLLALVIELPPLRQRKSDIKLLVRFFIEKYCARLGKAPFKIEEEALNKIYNYHWPGNVRQLENAIIYAVNMTESDTIKCENLPFYISETCTAQNNEINKLIEEFGIGFSLRAWEKVIITAALKASKNNVSLAAGLLGIGKSTMYRKILEHNIK